MTNRDELYNRFMEYDEDKDPHKGVWGNLFFDAIREFGSEDNFRKYIELRGAEMSDEEASEKIELINLVNSLTPKKIENPRSLKSIMNKLNKKYDFSRLGYDASYSPDMAHNKMKSLFYLARKDITSKL